MNITRLQDSNILYLDDYREPRGARLKGPDGHWVGPLHKRSPDVKRGDVFRRNRNEDDARERRDTAESRMFMDRFDEAVAR